MFCTRRFKIQIFEKRGFQNLIAMETSNHYAINVITNCCQLNVLDKVKIFGAGSFNVKNVIMDPAGDCAPLPPPLWQKIE